jgi:hypothetical protein
MSVSNGLVAAADKRILSVALVNILLMTAAKSEIAEFIPLQPGNFSKGDAQSQAMSFSVRPTPVFRCAEKSTHLATAFTAENRLIYYVRYCTYPEIGRTTWLMYDQYSQSFHEP